MLRKVRQSITSLIPGRNLAKALSEGSREGLTDKEPEGAASRGRLHPLRAEGSARCQIFFGVLPVRTGTNSTPRDRFHYSRCWLGTDIYEESSLRRGMRLMVGLACRMLFSRSLRF